MVFVNPPLQLDLKAPEYAGVELSRHSRMSSFTPNLLNMDILSWTKISSKNIDSMKEFLLV